jgi:SAM-dependent methyltransferase
MPVRSAVAGAVRSGLRRMAGPARSRRLLEVAQREIGRALDDDVYGASYFRAEQESLVAMGLSGYDSYDRGTSNADCAAYLIWRSFPVKRTLDVGCAMGFTVEALRELGFDAEGVDVSQWAVDHPAPGARGHLRRADLHQRLPFADGAYDLVTAFETLEHLPPELAPKAVAELCRVSNAYVLATIPSFGPNPYGPGGWFDGKVVQERVMHYRSLGPDYDGPIPHDDLFRDTAGQPIQGHLTIASFRWWSRHFEAAGLVRCGDVERRMHPLLAQLGLTKYWNLYVFRRPEVEEPPADLRSPEDARALEERWHLDQRTTDPEDFQRVAEALGTAG